MKQAILSYDESTVSGGLTVSSVVLSSTPHGPVDSDGMIIRVCDICTLYFCPTLVYSKCWHPAERHPWQMHIFLLIGHTPW